MSLAPDTEVRDMVAVVRRFVAGAAHFSHMVGPKELGVSRAKVHGVQPAIGLVPPRSLASIQQANTTSSRGAATVRMGVPARLAEVDLHCETAPVHRFRRL